MKQLALLACVLMLCGCQPAAPCRCAAVPASPATSADARPVGPLRLDEVLPYHLDVEYVFVGGPLDGVKAVERLSLDRFYVLNELPGLRQKIFAYERQSMEQLGPERLRLRMLNPGPIFPTGSLPPAGSPPPQRGSSGASSPPPARADPPGK